MSMQIALEFTLYKKEKKKKKAAKSRYIFFNDASVLRFFFYHHESNDFKNKQKKHIFIQLACDFYSGKNRET